MKIIFLQDTGPMVQSGNEFYAAGSRADLREDGAQWLIGNGYARPATVEPLPVVNEPEPTADIQPALPDLPELPALDYGKMTIADLRRMAKDAGVYRTGMRKADLISALESEE